MADPAVVLQELSRRVEPETDPAEMELVEKRLASLFERERRLVKLFSFGEVDEQVVRDQITDIRREQNQLQDRLRALLPALSAVPHAVDEKLLAQACEAVDRWLEQADESKRQLALEALQISIVATREQATVNGVIPLEPSEFFILQHASACTFASAKPSATGIPFSATFALAAGG